MEYATELDLKTYKQEEKHLTQFIAQPYEEFTVRGTLSKYTTINNVLRVTLTDGDVKETYHTQLSEVKAIKARAYKNHPVRIKFNTKDNSLIDILY